MTQPPFDPAKLRDNALASIKLGVEDFEISQKPEFQNGDPARALSAARNLFSGLLLLFKYKIATLVKDPGVASTLIYNPPEILPGPGENGGIKWAPRGNFRKTTIDLCTIQKRFDSFKIETDWKVIEKLRYVRNDLEHLHPRHSLGEIAYFVAELFPVLRDFIEIGLQLNPLTLLGHTWSTMLTHHDFFSNNRKLCNDEWDELGIADNALPYIDLSQCEHCGSPLIRPSLKGDAASFLLPDGDLNYVCIACSQGGKILPLIIKALGEGYNYDIRDGGEPGIEECYECEHETFVIADQKCFWCESELQYQKCNYCGESLRQEDQMNNGLCSYHNHKMGKVRDE